MYQISHKEILVKAGNKIIHMNKEKKKSAPFNLHNENLD